MGKSSVASAIMCLVLVSCVAQQAIPTSSLSVPVQPTLTAIPTLLSTPTTESSDVCLYTSNNEIKVACYFYGAVIAYMYQVADAKYTCENMKRVEAGLLADPEETTFVETHFDWQGQQLEQVTEQTATDGGKWYRLKFKGISGTVYHDLFIEDFKGRPCISLEKTVGLPIPTHAP